MKRKLKELVDYYCNKFEVDLESCGELANVYYLEYKDFEKIPGRVQIYTDYDIEKGKKYYFERMYIPNKENIYVFNSITEYDFYKKIVLYILQNEEKECRK